MASEPPEEAIVNFVSFTSTTREQAISFLKSNNLDSQKAINAYFEDPTGAQTKVKSLSGQTSGYYNDGSERSFDFGRQDNTTRPPVTAPPSRPPSRTNIHETTQGAGYQGSGETATQGTTAGSGQGLSLAEREEQELQQAVAMSLNQGLGQQETGVTTTSQPHFGKATRDHYDEGAWAMTLFNTSSQEVTISPDPEDRRRVGDEPAFIRPTQDNLYLGGVLTILHHIPLAREALLLRNKVLSDYGHDPQWWNGQSINLPKIVTVHDSSHEDIDWDDIIYETQRLMAFLDSTKRAFGSSDALANLKSISSSTSDSEEVVTRFLEAWHGAAIRADPENQLTTLFSSHAYKQPLFDEYEEPISRELFTLDPCVEPDHGQTLYDVLDTALWSDKAGEELEDVWLEHMAEVLVLKLDAPENAKSVDVKVPAVFYPDRYLSSCRDLAREFRSKRLKILEDVSKVDQLIDRYTTPQSAVGKLTVRELLEKAAAAVPLTLTKNMANEEDAISPEAAGSEAERLANELRAVSTKIETKLRELELRKQSAMETLRGYSKTLTEPSESPSEPPLHKYTLRGVCTEPHVTYVLKRNSASASASDSSDAMNIDGEKRDDYQWWRISFSAEDGKTRQAEKREAQGDNAAAQNGDTLGYTALKVREIEVLHAARDEWKSALLVYASENAMATPVDPAPSALQAFVRKDDRSFAAEFEESAANTDGNSDHEDWRPQQTSTEHQQNQQHALSQTGQHVNVFDYEVSGFDDEQGPGQEMQEKAGSSLLGAGASVTNAPASSAVHPDSEWNAVDGDEEMTGQEENARSR